MTGPIFEENGHLCKLSCLLASSRQLTLLCISIYFSFQNDDDGDNNIGKCLQQEKFSPKIMCLERNGCFLQQTCGKE